MQRHCLLPPRLLRRVCLTPWLYVPVSPSCVRGCSTTTTTTTITVSNSLPTRHGLGLDLSALRMNTVPKDNTPVVMLRGRVEGTRGGGRLVFLTLRQPPWHTIQIVCAGKALALQARSLTPESIVEVQGTLRRTKTPVISTSCPNVEIDATNINVLSAAATPLPFPLHDTQTKLDTRLNHRTIDLRTRLASAVMRLVPCLEQSFRRTLQARDFVEVHTPKLVASASEGGSAVFSVDYFGQHAWLAQSPQLYKQMAILGDLMRVYEVGHVYRAEKSLTHRHLTEFVGLDLEMVLEQSYLEVVTVVEEVLFRMLYDVQHEHADLLHAATSALCELGYTASSADTQRSSSLGESTASTPSPIVCTVSDEVIDCYGISETDATTCGERTLTLDVYHARLGPPVQYTTSTTTMSGRVLRMRFDDAVRLLRTEGKSNEDDTGVNDAMTDFTLPQERLLGRLIKQRYGVDLYVIDAFPLAARPFYTMPQSTNSTTIENKGKKDTVSANKLVQDARSCSFDVYLRGEEICSGAQREHNVAALQRRAQSANIAPTAIADYLASFRFGAWPHGGAGLGLERIAMFLLGAHDIRLCAMFPRDPKRLTP